MQTDIFVALSITLLICAVNLFLIIGILYHFSGNTSAERRANFDFGPTPVVEADMSRPISKEGALNALEELDDFARMDIGVDPIGAYRTLKRYIEQAGTSSPTDAKG